MTPTEVSPAEARRFLVTHLGLRRFGRYSATPRGASELLRDLRCIQLDPLDRIGTSPELVAMARIQEIRRGAFFPMLFETEAFEHWAKERCVLPGSAFATYRAYVESRPWMRMPDRYRGVSERDIDASASRPPACSR